MNWKSFGIIKIHFRKLDLFIYIFESGSHVARVALYSNWNKVWRSMIQIKPRISVEKIFEAKEVKAYT